MWLQSCNNGERAGSDVTQEAEIRSQQLKLEATKLLIEGDLLGSSPQKVETLTIWRWTVLHKNCSRLNKQQSGRNTSARWCLPALCFKDRTPSWIMGYPRGDQWSRARSSKPRQSRTRRVYDGKWGWGRGRGVDAGNENLCVCLCGFTHMYVF